MNEITGVDFSGIDLQDRSEPNHARPFDGILDVLGPMSFVEPVSATEAEQYRGRVPDGLLEFWHRHGRGAVLQGYAWLCDPALLQPIVEAVFADDPEFDAADFTCYLYEFDGRIEAWGRQNQHCQIDLTAFDYATVSVHGPGPLTHQRFGTVTPDYLVGNKLMSLARRLGQGMDEEYSDYHMFTSASNRLGRLEPGEIFGFFPSRQMGGEGYPEDMQKTRLVEHLLFHTQLDRATLRGWEPIPGGDGLSRPYPIRKLGPQPD
ncbi:GAD-like domain-containing protein [Roseinatronobacter alkalisoli]|uniref:GAD-like domain-containing protein n=1 Tax=Roseinatronobacter alkalisoli TaxID=3028235 RepID=A0ABT5TEE8_9RHOB|nr:GAD-like domain-containing protein [Roseinatronobacter sp. HJB301]MDD7973485.1 GAD-like domain-containing protein [Roseinatronobacter sp. HJB301]